MNDIKIFQNEQFGQVRIAMNESNEPLFCAKDVATALGYSDTADAIQRHCKSGKKVFHPHDNGVGGVNLVYIPEKDVYRLIMRSNLPDAEMFQDWVCDEVLPSIRKHGAYSLIPRSFAEALRLAADQQEQIEEQQRLINVKSVQIEELKPKATYYDEVLKSKNAMNITTIAKDYGMSGKAMNAKLHQLGIQYKTNDAWLPYQKYASQGYTKTETVPIKESKTGRVSINTKWTQKGRLFLYELLKSNGILPVMEQMDLTA